MTIPGCPGGLPSKRTLWQGSPEAIPHMQLSINGEMQDVPTGLTVTELLSHLNLEGPMAVERNREIIPRAEHHRTQLFEGDCLEIVHFVGGG